MGWDLFQFEATQRSSQRTSSEKVSATIEPTDLANMSSNVIYFKNK